MNGTGNAVEVKDLTIAFGDFKAVDGISFTVKKGEIFGFLGANGAGKTTTIRALCGLITPTSGTMRVAGVSPEDGTNLVKSKVGYMSQRFTLYNDLTVRENLEFTAALRKMKSALLKIRTDELFEFVGFDSPVDTLVKNLPGGIKQQVALTASILHDPEIIFLDEPTAGVTPAERTRFWNLIFALASKHKTVFVTTHYMDEAENCGRIALMQAGKIVALDSPDQLKDTSITEPMFEAEVAPGTAFEIEEEIIKNKIGDINPFGMRYHITVKDDALWQVFLKEHAKEVRVHPKRPSLEDVFIRTVGGKTP